MATTTQEPVKNWIDLRDMAICDKCKNKVICKSVEQISVIRSNLNKILSDNNLESLELGLKCTFFTDEV